MRQPTTVLVIFLMLGLPLVGTGGFMLIEDWGFLDSLYMSVITLSTVGFQEVRPLSTGGRIFVIAYIIGGLSVFVYSVTHVGEMVIQGEMRRFLGRRQMSSAMKSMRDHYVICGCGRLGRSLCENLAGRQRKFVLIDRDESALEWARMEGWNYVIGDATDDKILEAARIDTARGLAAVLPSDADNLFVVLSARLLRKDLTIISRAADEKSVRKLQRAGANRVISLYKTGAGKMAQLLTNPSLEDFMEILATGKMEFDIAQVQVEEGAPYCGQRLSDTDFRQHGINIVGIRKRGGELGVMPRGNARLERGDTLIALGDARAIAGFLESETA